jgi:KAP-like P-loop domain-containing protein
MRLFLSVKQLRIYGDRPIATVADDLYQFLPYADAFALLINDAETATPLTVAISGPWGSGKTSLAQLLETRLMERTYWLRGWDKAPITCWFNAWHHRDAAHLGAALAASVARQVSKTRPRWWRVVSPLPIAMLSPQRRAWRRVWVAATAAAAGLSVFMLLLSLVPSVRADAGPLAKLFDDWKSPVIWWAAIPAAVALLRSVFKVTDALSSFVDSPRSTAAQGSMAEVKEQLGRIVRQAQRRRWLTRSRRKRRVVIIVDDLERCPAEKALDMCEAATHLFGHPDVVTVLVADLDLIESAAASRYRPPHAEPGPAAEVGQEYLHKMIQLRFNLPPLDRGVVAAALGLAKAAK